MADKILNGRGDNTSIQISDWSEPLAAGNHTFEGTMLLKNESNDYLTITVVTALGNERTLTLDPHAWNVELVRGIKNIPSKMANKIRYGF